MKHARKSLLLLVTLLVLLGTQSNLNTSDSLNNVEIIQPISEHVIAADPITISSNAGFVTAGFNGSGTKADPYVFDGDEISVPSDENGFTIVSTTAYFVINNTLVSSTTANHNDGIY
ncbi:MAG: hypothetical protein RTV31_15495, partial [Candidatus Thorarchaeota archaeon]